VYLIDVEPWVVRSGTTTDVVAMKNAILATLLLLVLVNKPILGCSLRAMTLQQVSRDFSVTITHKRKPIAGIQVQITPEGTANEPAFTELTDENGRVLVRGLAVGKYYLTASHVDFEAGKEWIEVAAVHRPKAKRSFVFQWEDGSLEARRVAGTLSSFAPGDTGNKIMDLVHPKEIVHPGVSVTLQGAFSDEKYSVISDSTGFFMIELVPAGIYVLTIAGGAPSIYGVGEETRWIVDVVPASKVSLLPFQLKGRGCGGGAAYNLKPKTAARKTSAQEAYEIVSS
jgi:hypothetical protein